MCDVLGLRETDAGRRSKSRITMLVDVIHHGDPHVLGEHLCVEITALLERWGHETQAAAVEQVDEVSPGSDVSRDLPTISTGRRVAGGDR